MLSSDLPEEIRDLASVARSFANDQLKPLVRELERKRQFSVGVRDMLAGAGFLGVVIPGEYGGVDSDIFAEVVILEELSKVYPSASTILTAHWLPCKLIARHAPGEKEPAWLRDVLARAATGQWLAAIAATEPEAGSDLGQLRTRAERTEDGWRITGTKRFITNGGVADFYVVLARTGQPGPRGISAFLVEADRPGVRAVRFEDKMGLHGSATAEMVFDGVDIPADHVIGELDHGFRYIMEAFDEGRVGVAALALGTAQGALDAAVAYAAEREQFGRPIAAFQGLQFMVADMAIATHAARSLVYDAARAFVTGHPDASRLSAMAKTFTSDIAMQVTSDAVQVHGGYGYTADFPVEMLMRDTKINQIYEGTNQVQRMLIARSFFGGLAR